jgi:hypothetical protein
MDDTGKMATSIIAEISCPESPYLVGGPGLMSLDEQKSGLVEILNTGPEPVTLARPTTLLTKASCPSKLRWSTGWPRSNGRKSRVPQQELPSQRSSDRCADSRCPANTRQIIDSYWLNIEAFSVSTRTKLVTVTPSFTNYS